MAEVRRPRRYYLHRRIQARQLCDNAELVWKAKQEAEAGTPLVDGFPLKTELAALGYTTTEDLDGADQAELERAGLTQQQAKTVIAAI